MSKLLPAERLTWHRGADLRERDLTDWAAYEPELLALHVRSAHATWGVADGLDVALSANRRAVIVSPGIAFTCTGRVLGLESATTIAAPTGGAIVQDLVLAAPERAKRNCGGSAPPCENTHTVERALLRWLPRDHTESCRCQQCGPQPDRVPLARVTRLLSGMLGDVSYANRPIARARTRPAIGRGTVAAAALKWLDGPLALWAIIDTSDAQFTSTPLYFAALQGLPPLPARVIGPWLAVGDGTRNAFRLTLHCAAIPGMSANALSVLVRNQLETSAIHWFGVETQTGCGGISFDFAKILANVSVGGGP